MPVASVVGTGSASAAPQFVSVGITIRGDGETTSKARTAAKLRMDAFYDVLRQLEHAGVKVGDDGLKTQFSIAQRYDPEHKRPVSYQAHFHADVTSSAIDCAGEIFNLLCTVDGAEVSSPRFTISKAVRQHLKNEAFQAAVQAAKARFAFQCRVIGLDPTELEIASWHYDGPNYGGASSGKMLRVGSTEVAVSGAAITVSCDVRLTYDRKGAPPPAR